MDSIESTSALTKNHSITVLVSRSLNSSSLEGTILITGLVIGSLVGSVSLWVYLLKQKQRKTQKRDEQIRQREAAQPQVGQQAQRPASEERWEQRNGNTTNQYEPRPQQASLQTGYDLSIIPIEFLKRYKQDFIRMKREEGENETLLQCLDAIPGKGEVTFIDSVSEVNGGARDRHAALLEKRVRYIKERWMMDQGNYAGLTPQGHQGQQLGRLGLQRNNTSGSYQAPTSPKWQEPNYPEGIHLDELPPPSSVHPAPVRFGNTPPPMPARSASRSTERTSSTVRRPEHGMLRGYEQNPPNHSTTRWPLGNNSHNIGDLMNTGGSRQLTTADRQAHRQARPATIDTNFSAPSGHIPRASGVGVGTNRESQFTETTISDDFYGPEAERNYRLRDLRTRSPIHGQDYVAELEKLEIERRQKDFMEQKRRESEEYEEKKRLEEERRWQERDESPEQGSGP